MQTVLKIWAKFAMRIFAGNSLTRIPVCHIHSRPTLSVMVTNARLLKWLFEKKYYFFTNVRNQKLSETSSSFSSEFGPQYRTMLVQINS